MNRREFLALPLLSVARAATEHPNIVIFLADDLGWGEFLVVLCTDVMQEQRTIGGDPDILQAIPNLLGHGVLWYGAKQDGKRAIGFGLPLDVLDHEFAVVAKKVFDEAAGEALPG